MRSGAAVSMEGASGGSAAAASIGGSSSSSSGVGGGGVVFSCLAPGKEAAQRDYRKPAITFDANSSFGNTPRGYASPAGSAGGGGGSAWSQGGYSYRSVDFQTPRGRARSVDFQAPLGQAGGTSSGSTSDGDGVRYQTPRGFALEGIIDYGAATARRPVVQAPCGPPPSAIGHFLAVAGQAGGMGGYPAGCGGGAPLQHYASDTYAAATAAAQPQPQPYAEPYAEPYEEPYMEPYTEPYDPQYSYGYGGCEGYGATGAAAPGEYAGGGYAQQGCTASAPSGYGGGGWLGSALEATAGSGFRSGGGETHRAAAPAIDTEEIFSKIRHNRLEEVGDLLRSGVPLNLRDRFGNTMLAIACQNGLKRMSKLLLRQGADINATNYKGNTPLMFCFTYGYGDTLGQYLMSKGADSTMVNKEGFTCFEGTDGRINSK